MRCYNVGVGSVLLAERARHICAATQGRLNLAVAIRALRNLNS